MRCMVEFRSSLEALELTAQTAIFIIPRREIASHEPATSRTSKIRALRAEKRRQLCLNRASDCSMSRSIKRQYA